MTEQLPRDVHAELSDEALTARTCCHLWLTFRERLKAEARRLGYALAVHGSMKRDLDLAALPWVEGAAEPTVLADALAAVIPGAVRHPHVEAKPHGRVAIVIHVPQFLGSKAYIDLSIFPRKS